MEDLRKWETKKLQEFSRKLRKAISEETETEIYEIALTQVNKELRYRNIMQRGLWMYGN